MNRRLYDPVNKCCKECGCLLPDTPLDILHHTCSPSKIMARFKGFFEDSSRPKPKYKEGQEVSAALSGQVVWSIVRDDGKIIYFVKYDTDNYGYFWEDQIVTLPTPEDFKRMSNPKGE